MHKNRIRESIKFFISKFEINISKFEINISKFEMNISKFEIKKFNVSATLSNAVLKGFEITRLLFRVSSRKSGRQGCIREKGIRRRKKTKERTTEAILSLEWYHQESNRGHKDFQSFALPTELWHHH